jgi:hypothetical protein
MLLDVIKQDKVSRAHEQGLEVVVELPLIRRYKAKEGRRA